ncbi:MAG: hypothetical protein JWP27_954, partial [Flaviaesturariibacter sp.]|nr:hypothetical protein [Flaviaesturariibacter sp.]
SAGETIWFKAYLQSQGFPSTISTNFYAELIDARGTILEKKIFPIVEASAAGSFDLPANLREDGLVFRAYTTWMLNFDTAFLFQQPIRLLTKADKNAVAKPATTQLRFFPEGGGLVNDLESIVAFKATAGDFLPVAVTGIVRDDTGREITTFSSVHDGMGQFLLMPQAGRTYTAEWKDAAGGHKTVLPAASRSGAVIQARQDAHNVTYVLQRSEDAPGELKRVHLVAQMQQQVVYRASIRMQSTIISGNINTDSLTTGILQLTLFDSTWKPVAERIVFVNKDDYKFSAAINPYAKNLGKRAKNIVEIEVPEAVRSNLSVSITDGQLATGDESIYTRFLLTTDLRGAIYRPGYYFSDNSDSVRQHLDLLLLTNGWRRYNWEALAAGKLPTPKYPKDSYLTIQGKVYGAAPSELAANPQVNLILQTRDSARRILFAPVSKTGEFITEPLLFFDTATVYYSFNKSDRLNRNGTVTFASAMPVPPVAGVNAAEIARTAAAIPVSTRSAFFAQKRDEVTPEFNKRVRTLTEVVVQSKVRSREQELEKKYVTGLFQSGNSHSFNLIDDPFALGSYNIFTYLQGKVAGLEISGAGNDYTLSRRGSTPALYVDEMPAEMDYVSTISVSDVAYIKVIDPPFMGSAGGGAGGAISIYTRKGGDSGRSNGKGLEKGQIIGYAPIKDFYSPDYSHASPNDDIEDVRSTLLWNPYLLMDKTNRRVKLEFYNNDLSTSYRVVLEGVNENGKLTRVEKVIQ